MVFKELEIQGFKSFPDKVKIRFDEGVTGVVGPNGSGKSNLSDAVRWVLGETSSRQLRAAGKMEDVIFGGTRRRGAMGFAMVRLTLDNSAHTLDIDADEAANTTAPARANTPSTVRSAASKTSTSCCWTPASAGMATPSSGRAASRRSSPQRAASAARSSRRPAVSPSTATAGTRPSAVWPQRPRTSSVCETSSASWRPGSGRWKKRAKRPSASSS